MFQRITIVGRLGVDPEMRFLADGTPVTNFSVATETRISKTDTDGRARPCPQGWTSSYNDKYWSLTTWWRVACWRGLAESTNKYLEKGRLVFVEGTVNGEPTDGVLNPRVWTGQDGVPRASFEITANTVKFLGGRDDNEGRPAPPPVSGKDVLPY